jgi:predicted acetyltransferase
MIATSGASDLMDVRLRKIGEHEAASLHRWVDAYFSEVAKFRERPIGPVDAAGYRYLPLYWTEPGRHPFFLQADGTVAGFALVREVVLEAASYSELAEFFIQPASRRAGVGRRAARAVWQAFPGQWELQVALANRPATAFWHTCIEAVASGAVSREEFLGEDGRRIRYRFGYW